jgi:hypothetical protein
MSACRIYDVASYIPEAMVRLSYGVGHHTKRHSQSKNSFLIQVATSF